MAFDFEVALQIDSDFGANFVGTTDSNCCFDQRCSFLELNSANCSLPHQQTDYFRRAHRTDRSERQYHPIYLEDVLRGGTLDLAIPKPMLVLNKISINYHNRRLVGMSRILKLKENYFDKIAEPGSHFIKASVNGLA